MNFMDIQVQSRNEISGNDIQNQVSMPGMKTTDLRDELHGEVHRDMTSDVETGTTVFGLPIDDWMAARHELAMSPLLGPALMLSQSIGPLGLLASERNALRDALAYSEAGGLTQTGRNLLQVQQHLLDLERQQLPEQYRDLYAGRDPIFKSKQDHLHQQEEEREQEAKALRTRNVGEALEAADHVHAKHKTVEHLIEDAVQINELASLAPILDEHNLPDFG
jgi:hypothetical protein